MSTDHSRRNREILTYAAITALVLFRTLPWVIWGKETSHADDAFFGLMAKHIAEGKDFPVFRWGTSYYLAATSYLAAPLYWLFGSSSAVALMRIPMVLINLVVANGLAFLIRRDSRLSLTDTWICCLWFVLPSMLASRELAFASVGSAEAMVFILISWVFRERQVIGGLLCGIGYAIRPYSLFGIPGLLLIDWKTKGFTVALRNLAQWILGIVVTYSLILHLGRLSAYYAGSANPFYVKHLRHMLEDVRGFFADMVTRTVGFQTQRLDISKQLGINEYYNAVGLILCAIGAYLLFILLRTCWRNRTALWRKMGESDLQFGFFLSLTGAVNFLAYVLLSPPSPDIRYTLTLLPGLVGLYVLARQLATRRITIFLTIALALGMSLNNIYADVVAARDLRKLAQLHPTDDLIADLHQHGIRAFVTGEYFWSSYNITLDSNESIIVSDGKSDIWCPPYGKIYRSTPRENRALIQLDPCPGGRAVHYWYVCPAPS